jgi:ATP-binding cassette, subfamily B, multidrug efflux pump
VTIRTDFRRALAYAPRYRRDLVLGLGAVPFARAIEIAIPLILMGALDDIKHGTYRLELSTYFALVVALAVVKGVFKYAMRWYVTGASRRFEEDIRNDLFAHLLTLPPSWFQKQRTGDLMARLTSDVEAVRMFLGPGTMYVVETIALVPPVLGIMAFFSWRLALLLLLPIALIGWAMKHYAAPIHAEATRAQETLSGLSNVAQENFSGVRVVRAFGREREESKRFDASSEAYRKQNLRVADLRARSWAFILGARDLGILAIIAMGCMELYRGHITEGEFLLFNWYLALLFWPMVALGWMVGMYQRGKASMERLEQLFAIPSAITPDADAHRPATIRGDVEFKDLTIELSGRVILDHVSVQIPAGKVLGITGRTGSGKSTLAQVLPRLVDVPAGMAFVDGVDITHFDPRVLRRAIGYVPQEAFLFADRVRTNLALGRESEELPPLRLAATHAHVDAELSELPLGYESIVGERGVTLSGGQRQRSTLARALAMHPSILVLDDCLSAVDAETESRILGELTRALTGKTALLVSHRVAALSLCDEVIVLEDGKVVERGAPKDLLARRGRYYDLFARQQAEEALERLA